MALHTAPLNVTSKQKHLIYILNKLKYQRDKWSKSVNSVLIPYLILMFLHFYQTEQFHSFQNQLFMIIHEKGKKYFVMIQ